MSWRVRARRVIRACFDWRADVAPSGLVCVTARGATAGFGETQAIAEAKAVEATLCDLERDVVGFHGMAADQRFDAVRRAAILAAQRHAG
jgi:hypothetical protein